jgi:hypothetical protein
MWELNLTKRTEDDTKRKKASRRRGVLFESSPLPPGLRGESPVKELTEEPKEVPKKEAKEELSEEAAKEAAEEAAKARKKRQAQQRAAKQRKRAQEFQAARKRQVAALAARRMEPSEFPPSPGPPPDRPLPALPPHAKGKGKEVVSGPVVA